MHRPIKYSNPWFSIENHCQVEENNQKGQTCHHAAHQDTYRAMEVLLVEDHTVQQSGHTSTNRSTRHPAREYGVTQRASSMTRGCGCGAVLVQNCWTVSKLL